MPKAPGGLHIDRFSTGLVTNRAAISTPFRQSYGHHILLQDALIDGSNMEISPANTLVRRPGFPKYCTAAFSGTAKGFKSAILNGTLTRFFDTSTDIYTFDTTTITSIYTKGTTAQTRYQQVGNYVFLSDGNANKKYDGEKFTNAGVGTPAAAPTIPNLNWWDSAGASQTTHTWSPSASYANTTASAKNYYLMSPTGEIFWSVVPAGTTLTSQSSAPNWSSAFNTLGAVVKDGTMTWTNCKAPTAWAANTGYSNSTYVTTSAFSVVNTQTTLTATGSTSENWAINGTTSAGFGVAAPTTGDTNVLTSSAHGFAIPTGATVKGVQVTLYRAANRANAVSDVTIQLVKAGTPGGNNKAAAGYWPSLGIPNFYSIPTTGGVQYIYGSNTDLWGNTLTPSDINNAGFGVKIVAHQGSTSTTTAAITNSPVKVTVYYTIATSDITGTVYSQVVTDSNGNLQRVKTSGTSAGSAPTWSATIGGTTTDNTVTWECLGTANQLPTLFNRSYATSFHTSSSHTSTLSPVLTLQAPIIGNNVNIQAYGSDDTQVDRNDLYRSLDGGSLLFFDTSAPNVASTTSYTINDTALDADLNILLIGPVAHANDAPPSGATLLAFHTGRMWAAVGNLLYFSAGPDCLNGDGNQSWPTANVFTFAGPITGLAPTSRGLVAYTATDVSVVLGGPQLQTYWVQPLIRSFGINNANCLDVEGDDMVLYTSQKQVMVLSPDGKDEIGFNVAFTVAANFDPTTAYIAIHRSGQDQGIFMSDAATKVLRYNMNAQAWDSLATISSIGPIGSVDTALGTRSLLSTTSTFIVARDTTVFQDSGSSYSGYATIGSLLLSEFGEEPARIKNIVVTSAAVGTAPTVSVLPNEVSGSFTSVPFTAAIPWRLTASATINMKRYDWLGIQSALADIIQHVQIKLTIPTEAAKNEVYAVSVL